MTKCAARREQSLQRRGRVARETSGHDDCAHFFVGRSEGGLGGCEDATALGLFDGAVCDNATLLPLRVITQRCCHGV
jgi:hypothetical protein